MDPSGDIHAKDLCAMRMMHEIGALLHLDL
jgi:hypothetical protein